MQFVLIMLLVLLAFGGGWLCAYFVLEPKRKRLEDQQRRQAAEAERLAQAQADLSARQQHAEQEAARLRAARIELDFNAERLKAAQAELHGRAVSYRGLQDENAILKRDLRNLHLHVQKLRLDQELQQQAQGTLDERINDVGSRYLKDNVKWIGSSLTPNNFANCKQRLLGVIERCRAAGLAISTDEVNALVANLKQEFELIVRAAFEREEQARLKAQIREEQLREREIERELKQLEREREAVRIALDKALAETRDLHSAEVQRLQQRLAEVEERSLRAISQAQLTKSGHVYVISNIGSFGEGVFKVGMTRRFEPLDRVRELGDASVPFPFDVHMMIRSNDAPSLETALHRKLHKLRLNKTNPRKEFFKVDIESIHRIVKEHHGEVEYVVDAEALQFRQSLMMPDEDQEFIEKVYDEVEEESVPIPDGA